MHVQRRVGEAIGKAVNILVSCFVAIGLALYLLDDPRSEAVTVLFFLLALTRRGTDKVGQEHATPVVAGLKEMIYEQVAVVGSPLTFNVMTPDGATWWAINDAWSAVSSTPSFDTRCKRWEYVSSGRAPFLAARAAPFERLEEGGIGLVALAELARGRVSADLRPPTALRLSARRGLLHMCQPRGRSRRGRRRALLRLRRGDAPAGAAAAAAAAAAGGWRAALVSAAPLVRFGEALR
jgi:hypothetical protein